MSEMLDAALAHPEHETADENVVPLFSKLDANKVMALRQRYWQNHYRPLAVWNADAKVDARGKPIKKPGKHAHGNDWIGKASKDPPEASYRAPWPDAMNTGILCGEVVGADVDVLDEGLCDAIVKMIEERLSPTPLVRVGRPPKTLLVYCAEKAFAKVETPMFVLKDGTDAKVEFLATGQMFVADGIHPDTGLPYRWVGEGSPDTVPRSELPAVTEPLVKEVVRAAERMLREAGAVEKDPKSARGRKRKTKAGKPWWVSNVYGYVNAAALANIDAWITDVFPQARAQRTGAWRVSSKSLGRDLEEDLSIHPDGISDFGEERGLTPISLVMAHRGITTERDAATWLCERLGIELTDQGVSVDDFWAYMPMHNYIFAPARAHWPGSSVNSRLPPVGLTDKDGKPTIGDDGDQIFLRAADWLDRFKSVEQMTWAPGLPEVIEDRLIMEGGWIERPGVRCYNLYLPPAVKLGDARKAEPWFDHVKRVYPDEVSHIIYYLAHCVQRPQVKINHALVLGGEQGIGKDSLLEPVKHAVGAWNFQEASPSQVLGRFNGFLKSVILRISEARDLGDADRFEFYDHMKTYTAAPPDVLRCDEKHLREHYIVNCGGVIITTNHKTDGVYLPADDRRHFVAWSELVKEMFPDGYWNELWNYYEDGGIGHVAALLTELDLSRFDPKAPPPKTPAFWAIVDANRPPEESELADLIDRLESPNALTLDMLVNVAPDVIGEVRDWLRDRRNRRVIPHRLEKCGYVPVRNDAAKDGQFVIGGQRMTVYGKRDQGFRDQVQAAHALKQERDSEPPF